MYIHTFHALNRVIQSIMWP